MNDVLREQIQLNTKEVVVNVDNDHMKASIVLNGIGSDEAYTYEEIADKLSQAGVRTGINEARIREVILNKLYDIEIVVAEGKSAVNGTDGYYNFFFDSEYERDNKPTLREDGSVDYFNVKLFEKVNKDDKLAEYIEPTKGEFGYDIFGKLLVPKPGRPGPKLRGKGFTVSEDGKSYYAQLSGKVEYRNYDLNVSNVYNVSGDVDVGTGSIDFNGDVEINGSVRGSVKIHAMGNIYIGGYVEDADIWSGQDIIIQDGVNAGENGRIEAVAMIDPRNLDTLLHPQFDAAALKAAEPVAKALGASPGAACGKVVFTADDAVAWAARGEKVVLVRLETSPEDITGMKSAQGILTVRGGMTSHAAVVARGMGTCCVSGCGDITMDEENKKFTLAGKEYHEGDFISLDGSTGNIYDGVIATVDATIAGEFGRIMGWADKYRTMKVRTNADTPADAKKARELGAEGIGLCRTEHMFFEGNRIDAFREMICSETVEEREAALAKILPEQQGDFEKLYEALEGNPVTIRFLDPPLHEFVPTEEEDIKKLADAQGKTVEQIKAIIDSLHEFNPMMGHRGCRLAVTYPEIAKMQTSAVIRAAINVKNAHPDWNVKPEIMIPLVGDIKELKYVKKFVVETADAEIKAAGSDLEYEVGTMIEIPRAALTADDIAKEADFFCFGTNDLTQMTYGFSRDDAGKFLDAYYDAKIFENDPFAKLDQTGVGKLMDMAIKLGKPVNPNLHVGICGEHGGDPSSVEFCNKLGLDYVSCSPFRVPIARLAAAQAAIAEKNA